MSDARITAVAIAAVLFSCLAGAAMAAGEGEGTSHLYEWKDDRGVVNVTDDLSKVPGKYRSKARSLDQPGPGNTVQEQQQPQEPSVSDEAADNAAQAEVDRKAEWQQRMRNAKQRLTNAEDRYRQLEQTKQELTAQWGSSGAALPPQEAIDKADQLDGDMDRVSKEISVARDQVNVVIPDQARRAGIPPGWLREVQ